MGFRNPATTAEGIDTGNLNGARIRTDATSDQTGFGRLETATLYLATGVPNEAEAYLQAQSTPNLAGDSTGATATWAGVGWLDPATLAFTQPRIEQSVTPAGRTSINLAADDLTANGKLLAGARFLDEDFPGTSATVTVPTVVATKTITVPAGLDPARRIRVEGTCYVQSATGVGPRLQVDDGGAAVFTRVRSINVGAVSLDMTTLGHDTNLTPGPRTYRLVVAQTVAGGSVTYRIPHLSVSIV